MSMNGDRDENNRKRKNSTQEYAINQSGSEIDRKRKKSGKYQVMNHQNGGEYQAMNYQYGGEYQAMNYQYGGEYQAVDHQYGGEYQAVDHQHGRQYPEIHRNRQANQIPSMILHQQLDEKDDDLALSLRCGPKEPSPDPRIQKQPPLSMQPPTATQLPHSFLAQAPDAPQLPNHHSYIRPPPLESQPPLSDLPSIEQIVVQRQIRVGGRGVGARRNPTQAPRRGKNETVPAPYPWATTHRAIVHTIEYLQYYQITTIAGGVQCKRCEKQYEMSYNLLEKFREIQQFIVVNKEKMRDRAPSVWMNPTLPACLFCKQENSAKPVASQKKKRINWLFLFLSQTLGCCTLEQLKYFCKHNKNHRTGAKDRLVYMTYLGLCKQLDPRSP